MCMSGPDGYGSISNWYQWRSSPPLGCGFGVWKARSSSQTRCHFSSIGFGSYLSMGTKKPLTSRGRGKLSATWIAWASCVREGTPAGTCLRDFSKSLSSRPTRDEEEFDGRLYEAEHKRGRRGPGSEVRYVAGHGISRGTCPARAAERRRQLFQARAELSCSVRAYAQRARGGLHRRRWERAPEARR